MARAIPAADLPRELVAAARGQVRLGPDSPLRDTTRRPRRDDEHRMQRELIEWRDRVVDRVAALRWLAAIPNGGARSKRAAGRAKAEGVARGVPDLVLATSGTWTDPCDGRTINAAALWIEMKTPNGRVSDEQATWLRHLWLHGHGAVVCYSAAEARAALCAYLGVVDPEGGNAGEPTP